MILSAPSPLSLYIHIPWCIQKCPYCDFNSHAVKNNTPETRYIEALLSDLDQSLQRLEQRQRLETIFIGGGTPSLFAPESLDRLLTGIAQRLEVSDTAEITLEANPGTFESKKFAEFYSVGINRLSIGIQSFNNQHLKALGRIHNASEAKAAVEIAVNAGFENFNLDLMFGLPQQREEEAVNDIQTAISLNPTHLSFYQLTLEPNTWFYKFPPELPQDERIFSAQKKCQAILAEYGYRQYEISAYCKEHRVCRHNVNYWRFGDYLGIGAGAHGKISQQLPDKILRTVKPKSPEQYLNEPCGHTLSIIGHEDLVLEFMMNALRLRDGFSFHDFQRVTGLNNDSLEPALSRCINLGLLTIENDCCRCSEKGWDFLDSILEQFIKNL